MDRLIFVEFLHRNGDTVDGSAPLDAVVPGRGPVSEAGRRIVADWHGALDADEREDHRNLVRGYGRHYGYPECCIEAYLRDRFVELREARRTTPSAVT